MGLILDIHTNLIIPIVSPRPCQHPRNLVHCFPRETNPWPIAKVGDPAEGVERWVGFEGRRGMEYTKWLVASSGGLQLSTGQLEARTREPKTILVVDVKPQAKGTRTDPYAGGGGGGRGSQEEWPKDRCR